MIPSRPFAFAVDVLHYRRGDDATTAGFSYLTAASAKIVQGTKNPERRTFRDFLIQLPYNSGLADLVDVAGEVDHLVGEAPLVEGDTLYLPPLASLARTSRTHCYARFSSLSLFSVFNFGGLFFLFVVVLHTTTIFVLDYNNKMSAKQAPDPFCTLIGGR